MSEAPIQNKVEPKHDQSSEEEQQSQSKIERMPKRIGIIGYGHLGKKFFLLIFVSHKIIL